MGTLWMMLPVIAATHDVTGVRVSWASNGSDMWASFAVCLVLRLGYATGVLGPVSGLSGPMSGESRSCR